MLNQFSRTELLIGTDGIKKLSEAKVAIFGIGGVGSFVVEGLVRAGIEKIVLIDNDNIELTNLNRQIHATHSTLGKSKVNVMEQRILDINPNAKVEKFKEFYLPDNSEKMINKDYTYIVDAIDTVTAKIDLIEKANKLNIPIISCMGTGNKMNPTMLEVTDIYKTSECPLAKVIRQEMRKRNIKKLKVVYSREKPIEHKQMQDYEEKTNKRQTPGSISFVPSVAGMIIASEVVKDILKNEVQ